MGLPPLLLVGDANHGRPWPQSGNPHSSPTPQTNKNPNQAPILPLLRGVKNCFPPETSIMQAIGHAYPPSPLSTFKPNFRGRGFHATSAGHIEHSTSSFSFTHPGPALPNDEGGGGECLFTQGTCFPVGHSPHHSQLLILRLLHTFTLPAQPPWGWVGSFAVPSL